MALLLVLQEVEQERNMRRNRVFRDRLNPLDVYDDYELIKRCRMPRTVILKVIDLIENDVEHPTRRSHAIPAAVQIMRSLRYYATGNFQYVSGDLNAISQPSVSRIILRVSSALERRAQQFIKFPVQQQEQQIKGFYDINRHRIPNVLGCVDGSLIPIKAPSEHEEIFVCRKSYHAINIQGICSHDMKFTNIVVRWPGSIHDAFMWNNCALNEQFENGRFGAGLLLGDSAYPLRPWLITPILQPQNIAETQFNVHHRRTRQIIENTFGRWKMRWPCLHKFGGALTLKPERYVKVITATAVLHNICEENDVPLPGDAPVNLDDDPELDINPAADNRNDGHRVRNRIIAEHFMQRNVNDENN